MEESTPFKPINLLIVEDQQIIVDGLIMILNGHPKLQARCDSNGFQHAQYGWYPMYRSRLGDQS